MKKGFTLIELLAVILILGIIALIVIPTVNKIIAEARYGAFKSGNENIMKQVVQDCQTSMMKGENLKLSYLFTEGKSSNEINIKGSLPNDGYIILNRNCEITDYYLTDNKNVHSNDEDVREDYMLKPLNESQKSLFNTMYSDYYDKIISVDFINNLNIHENAIEIKDPSVSEKGKIKSWLIPDGENYKLYIGSERNIYANYDSSFLFRNMGNVVTINTENFNTSFTTNMAAMFLDCDSLKSIDVSKWNTSNVFNMESLFAYCKVVEALDVSDWVIDNVVNFRSIFNHCQKITYLDLSKWNTSSATNMRSMFYGCFYLTTIKGIENFKTDKVTTMYWMFNNCNRITNLNLSNWNVDNVEDMTYIFICPKLKELNISSWSFSKISDFSTIFHSCNELTKLSLKNATVTNNLANILPDRRSLETGVLTVVEDKTEINTEVLSAKNWNVI